MGVTAVSNEVRIGLGDAFVDQEDEVKLCQGRMGIYEAGQMRFGWLCRRRSGARTCATLQLWMQIVGKVRLALTPQINHTWNVTLYPTVCGLTTSPMPHGKQMLQIDFDFIEHALLLRTSGGGLRTVALKPMTVAAFYAQVMEALKELGTPVRIWPTPVEIANAIPFEKDETHQAYDPEYAQRFWRVLLQTTRVFTFFRARFTGKVSPVHLFWGAMDLACTRFSGRTAPEHPSMPGLPDRVTRDAYSHEVSSCGFWPGARGLRRFSIAMLIRSRRPMRRLRSGRRRRGSMRSLGSSFCRMKRCGRRPTPMLCCWSSCKARMRLRRTAPVGPGCARSLISE